MKTLLAVCLTILVLGCGTVQPTPTPTYDCGTVCAHGRELGCDWAAWTPLSNCLDACSEWQDVFFFNMQCMSTAATCAAAEKCQDAEKTQKKF